MHKPDGQSMCGVGRGETAAVDIDGQVHGCVMFAESYQVFPTAFLRNRLEAMRMGSLHDAGFGARMAAYPAAARAADLPRQTGEIFLVQDVARIAATCRAAQICPVSIGNIPGNTDPRRVPDFLCTYNLVSLGYRDRFPYPPSLARPAFKTGTAQLPELTEKFHAAFLTQA